MRVYVDDIFFIWVYFGAIELFLVSGLWADLNEFFVNFWQIWIKWLLHFLLILFLIIVHQLPEWRVLFVFCYQVSVRVDSTHFIIYLFLKFFYKLNKIFTKRLLIIKLFLWNEFFLLFLNSLLLNLYFFISWLNLIYN